MISPEYITLRIEQGRTIDEIATELEITPRHVRRLAKAGGWTPPPRRHLGPRTLKVQVSAETYAALEKRGGRSVEDTAAALLALVADRDRLEAEREASGRGESHVWSAGYLDALVGRIAEVK
jgi:predicted transcriptional regulator